MFLSSLPNEFLPISKSRQEKINSIWRELLEARDILVIGPGLKEITPENLPQHFSHILYIDGGAKHFHHPLLQTWRTHSLVIGDKDSFNELKNHHDIEFDLELPPQKDESDLAFALRLLSPKVRNMTLLGFSGGRFDHELSNLGVLDDFLNYAHSESPIEITIDQSLKIFGPGKKTIQYHGIFSLFSFKTQLLTIEGDIEYPVTEKTTFKTLHSHGLSNKAHGEVIINSEANILVIFPAKDRRHLLF